MLGRAPTFARSGRQSSGMLSGLMLRRIINVMPRIESVGVTKSVGIRTAPSTSTRRPAAGIHRVLLLQRAVGNRTVASILSPTIQRDPPADPKQVTRAKVTAAMIDLQKKYGLAAVTEGEGRTWTLDELRFVDQAFANMSRVERRNLSGLTLTRVAKLFQERDGKQEPVAGRATNGTLIELADTAMRDLRVPLHEAGHVIQSRAVRQEEEQLYSSPVGRNLDRAWFDLTAASKKLPPRIGFTGPHADAIREFATSIATLNAAGTNLLESDPEGDTAALHDAFLAADVDAATNRRTVQGFTTEAWVPQLLAVHDRQRDWVAAITAWIQAKAQRIGRRRDYTDFVDIVNRNKLARRSFAPFTAYVQKNWPRKPGEFFAQSYAVYRTSPKYLKDNANELFKWFEKGGHLATLTPTQAAIEDLRDQAPVIGELADEFVSVFGPIPNRLAEVLP